MEVAFEITDWLLLGELVGGKATSYLPLATSRMPLRNLLLRLFSAVRNGVGKKESPVKTGDDRLGHC